MSGALRISSLLSQCLINRGVSDPTRAADFLEPRLNQLGDPFLLPDMAPAVDRLFLARSRDEPLVIFGDYDVDGVTSTALLSEVLTALGWRVHQYLPHRLDEGYGLTRDGVENCLQKFPARLLLAVDCGSTAIATIDWLRQRGVDVIVLDHHQVSRPPPAALALVNPQLQGSAGVPPAHPPSQPGNLRPRDAGSAFAHLCLAALLRATSVRHAQSRSGKSASMRRSISGNTSRIRQSAAGLLPVPGSPTTPSQRCGGSAHPGVACAQRACPINADAAASNGATT